MVLFPKNSNIHNLHHFVPSFQTWKVDIIRDSKQECIINQLSLVHCVTRQKIRSGDKVLLDIIWSGGQEARFSKEKKMTKLQELSEIKLTQCSQKGFSYSVLCLLTVKAARRGTTQWRRYKMVNDPKSLPLVLSCTTIVWGKSLSYIQFKLIDSSYLNWQPSFIQQLYSKLYILSIVQKEKHTWWGKKNNLGLKVTEIMYKVYVLIIKFHLGK